jgi:hypothetical protein
MIHVIGSAIMVTHCRLSVVGFLFDKKMIYDSRLTIFDFWRIVLKEMELKVSLIILKLWIVNLCSEIESGDQDAKI